MSVSQMTKDELAMKFKAVCSKLKYANIVIQSQEEKIHDRDSWAVENLCVDSQLWKYINANDDFRWEAEQLTVIDKYENKKGKIHMAHYYRSGHHQQLYYLGSCKKLGDRPIITTKGKIKPSKKTHKIKKIYDKDDGEYLYKVFKLIKKTIKKKKLKLKKKRKQWEMDLDCAFSQFDM